MRALNGKNVFFALGLVLLLRPAWSAPASYELLIEAPHALISERLSGFLERNLPEVAVVSVLPGERYRKFAQFPVSACTGSEYFLIAHGKRLIAFGCMDDASVATEFMKIRRALQSDREIIREPTADALYDGALYCAAAGEWAAARRYAELVRTRRSGDAVLHNRLLRLLAPTR